MQFIMVEWNGSVVQWLSVNLPSDWLKIISKNWFAITQNPENVSNKWMNGAENIDCLRSK